MLTRDDALVEALVAEPTIANVHRDGHATCAMAPGMPHDSYLGEFLMRTTGIWT